MEKILPAFSEKNISICFSSNDKYAPLIATSIASIIDHSSSENNYDIIILITQMSDENKINIISMIREYPNFSIRFVNVGSFVFGYQFYTESELTNTKYSEEIYYRVLVPSLMSEYKKVIFLDADTILLDDIAKFYENDIDGYYVGAIRDFEGIATCYTHGYERTKYRINDLGIKNFEDYFVSGVMLMNIPELGNKFNQQSLLELAVSKDWRQYDQDLFNYICKNNVKILDASWNFVEDIEGIYKNLPSKLFEEFLESEKHPKLIHYSGNRKPWIKTDSKYTKVFWDYAKKTKYFETLSEIKNKYE